MANGRKDDDKDEITNGEDEGARRNAMEGKRIVERVKENERGNSRSVTSSPTKGRTHSWESGGMC